MSPILLNFSNKPTAARQIVHPWRSRRVQWISLCTVILECAIGTAAAADAPAAPPSDALEEVTVTATKRSESVQNVPLSITTFSEKELEQKSITNFFDYGTKVPNLAFAMTGDGVGTSRTISIRGISGDNTTGFYIDDTPLPDSIDPRVLDIDHIEVLRGPQGTLYGASGLGGVIKYVTVEPSTDGVHGHIEAGLSDSYNGYDLDRKSVV